MDIKSEKTLCFLSKLLFILYLIVLIWVVVFKCNIAISLTGGYLYFKTITFHERLLMYIVPFKNYFVAFKMNELIDSIFNCVIFIPLGLYLSYFISKKKLTMALFLSFGVSLFFELFQLFSLMGSFQTEDLIVNTLGAVIGYLLYKLLYKDDTKRIYILNWVSIIFLIVLIPLVLFATVNTIINFDLYIAIIGKTY